GIRDFHVTGVQTCALPILVLKGDASQGQLKVTEFSAKGPDLEIVSDGSIRLRDPVQTSFLSLALRFRFTDRYANKNETTRALFRSEERRVGDEGRTLDSRE